MLLQIINYHEISFFRTHNLEVPGSSPGWSTLKIKELHQNVAPFSLFCEQFANKIAFCEHQYNLSAIIDSLILFANPIIFVRKPFFGILFSNINNTSKTFLSDVKMSFHISASIALFIQFHPTTFFTATFSN